MSQELTFSIVIPTYNRPKRLRQCLESIAQLDYPRDRFEVIVVDDGSPMSLESLIKPFAAAIDLTLMTQPNAGPARARNTGAAQAKGEFLAFTDDDCLLASDWLSKLSDRFQQTPHCMIGGKTLNALPDNLYSTASQGLIDFLYAHYVTADNESNFFASNNLALPTARFQALGGFDTTFPLAAGEDRELCDRWLRFGYRMVYAPEAQIHHAHQLTPLKFWQQHFNYGRGAFHYRRVRAQQGQTVRLESLLFYSKLLTYPFFQSTSQPAILLAILMFVSQVANAAGFFWQHYSAAKQMYLRRIDSATGDPTIDSSG